MPNMTRRRLSLAAVVALALVGVLAGLVATRGSSARPAQPGLIAKGKFVTRGWETLGTASIVRRADGSATLQIRHFRTQAAPELVVLMQPNGDSNWHDRRLIAPLKRAWGSQDYGLPAGVAANPRQTVTIFCTKCGKPWGYARLSLTMLGRQTT
jgi:Electron transfer DM13